MVAPHKPTRLNCWTYRMTESIRKRHIGIRRLGASALGEIASGSLDEFTQLPQLPYRTDRALLNVFAEHKGGPMVPGGIADTDGYP